MTTVTTDMIAGTRSSLAYKAPVRVATTAAITLSGEQTIDGVAVVAGDRVLDKDNATGASRGIYVAATGAWTRAGDWDGARDIVTGTQVYVTAGTLNGGRIFRVATTGEIVIGTTSISLTELALSTGGSAVTTLDGDELVAVNQSGTMKTATLNYIRGLLKNPSKTDIQTELDLYDRCEFTGTVSGTGDITVPDGAVFEGRSFDQSILSGIGVKRSGTARIDSVRVGGMALIGAGLDFTGISTSKFHDMYIESASGGFCIKGGSPDDDDTNDPCYYNGFEDIRYFATGSGAKGVHLLAMANQNHFRNVTGSVDDAGGWGVYAENTAAFSLNGVTFDNFSVEGNAAVGVELVDAGNNLAAKFIDIAFNKPRVELSGTTTGFKTTGHCKLGVANDSMQVTRKFNLSTYTKLRASPNAKTVLLNTWGAIGVEASDFILVNVDDMGVRVDFSTPVTVNPTGGGGSSFSASFTHSAVVYDTNVVRLWAHNITGGSATPAAAYWIVKVDAASDV